MTGNPHNPPKDLSLFAAIGRALDLDLTLGAPGKAPSIQLSADPAQPGHGGEIELEAGG